MSLLLAHFAGDFVLQTDSLCKQKREKKARSWFLYVHALVIFVLALIALWDIRLWYAALAIGVSHLLIDLGKVCTKKDNVWVFVIDQVLHVIILVIVTGVCVKEFEWIAPEWFTTSLTKAEAIVTAAIICWKPANHFIKETLQFNSVFVPSDDSKSFHAGKLIGTIERWLILVFILIGRYEVIGFLIAAKSIIRFGEGDKEKTEYFLAGTLLSIAVAVVSGLLIIRVVRII